MQYSDSARPRGQPALAADGSLWIIDSSSPNRLLHLEATSGALLGSINTDLSAGTQPGLQVVPQTFTLDSTSVPAGSLLVTANNQPLAAALSLIPLWSRLALHSPQTRRLIEKLSTAWGQAGRSSLRGWRKSEPTVERCTRH